MNIVVTGGRGFIGRKLIEQLLRLGHKVTSIDRTYKSNTSIKGCKYITEDINAIQLIDGSDFDICFHLAAIHLDKATSFTHPSDTFDTILVGTERVAKWCVTNNIKLIYSGSSSKFFSRDQSPYTVFKASAEDLLRSYQKFFNLDLDIATIYNVYGYCEKTRTEGSKLLSMWNEQAKTGRVNIYGPGTQVKDFIHVDDVVLALLKLIDNTQTSDNWHIGSGDSYSVKDIFRFYSEIYPNLIPNSIVQKNVDNSDHKLVNRDFLRKFNWTPIHSLPNYIKTFYNADTGRM